MAENFANLGVTEISKFMKLIGHPFKLSLKMTSKTRNSKTV